MQEHEGCPYPEQEDIAMLMQQTDLTEKQIRVWFTNYRNASISLSRSLIFSLAQYFTNLPVLTPCIEEVQPRRNLPIQDKIRDYEEELYRKK